MCIEPIKLSYSKWPLHARVTFQNSPLRSTWPATLLNRKYYNIIIDRVVRLLHNFSPKKCWKRKKIKGCWTNHQIATWLEKLQSMPHSLFLTPAYLHYQQHLRYQTKPAFLFLHIRLFSPKIIIREKAAYHVSLEAGSKAIPPLILFKVSCVVADTMKGNIEALASNCISNVNKKASKVVWFLMFW